MNLKQFYDDHTNFSLRSIIEYEISPGIKCKFDLILDNLDKYKSYNIGLDLGCSGNSFLHFLKSVKKNIFLDISEIPLSQYTSEEVIFTNYEEKPKNNNPVCGDISRLPYANEQFDFICSLDTLEHVKNDVLAIMEMSRVLKDNGICIITVPHRKDYYSIQDQIIG
ncbi:MAG: class I SAM-dependent methyltransferase, partial [Candidatus Lokiarchaeota archaeon]